MGSIDGLVLVPPAVWLYFIIAKIIGPVPIDILFPRVWRIGPFHIRVLKSLGDGGLVLMVKLSGFLLS